MGLYATGADWLQLLSHSLILNADLHANEVEAVTGANPIILASGALTPQAGKGAVQALVVDVGTLGGLYAGSIYLIGTEARRGHRGMSPVQIKDKFTLCHSG